jgi:hypothetical protein
MKTGGPSQAARKIELRLGVAKSLEAGRVARGQHPGRRPQPRLDGRPLIGMGAEGGQLPIARAHTPSRMEREFDLFNAWQVAAQVNSGVRVTLYRDLTADDLGRPYCLSFKPAP